jgi:hypothetical protein
LGSCRSNVETIVDEGGKIGSPLEGEMNSKM